MVYYGHAAAALLVAIVTMAPSSTESFHALPHGGGGVGQSSLSLSPLSPLSSSSSSSSWVKSRRIITPISSSSGSNGGGGGGGSSSSNGSSSRRHISAVLDGDNTNFGEYSDGGNGDTSRAIFSDATAVDDKNVVDDYDDDDDDIAAINALRRERRKRVVRDRCRASGRDRFVYEVTLPFRSFPSSTTTDTDAAAHAAVRSSLGMSIRSVETGTRLSDRALDLDTFAYQSYVDEMRGAGFDRRNRVGGRDGEWRVGSVELLDSIRREVLDESFRGLVVSSVVRGGLAWEAGIRVGDEVLATSATLGDKLWPKSTLDGVRSALSSRKIASNTVTLQLRRSGAHIAAKEVVEEFELSLTRPLGIEVEDDLDDGYVKVSGFTDTVRPDIRDTLKVGDRIVAVDSSLGNRLWPVSNVEGLVSACTSRLPGQPVRMKFERVVEVGEWTTTTTTTTAPTSSMSVSTKTTVTEGANGNVAIERGEAQAEDVAVQTSLTGAIDGFRKLKDGTSSSSSSVSSSTSASSTALSASFTTTTTTTVSSPTVATTTATVQNPAIRTTGSKTHKMLLSRCRDVMRQYMEQDMIKTSNASSGSVSNIPALVADRVLEALADASAPLDCKTLNMIMNAYLSSRKPDGAIRAFEAAVGLAGDGSARLVNGVVVIEGKKNADSQLPSDLDALDLFTSTALLRAHALRGDYISASRVLAAMEGREGYVVGGIAAASWPRLIGNDGGGGGGGGGSGNAKGGRAEMWRTDSRCYNIVLAATSKCGTADAVKAAIELFDGMSDPSSVDDPNGGRKRPPVKTAVSYNTMIGIFAKAGRLQDAYTIFYGMKQAGFQPDKYSYTALIKAAVSSGDVNQGRSLLTEMESEGIDADAHSYNTVIKGLCDKYRWYEAKELVTEMEWNGVSPDSLTYGLLMNGLLRSNKPGPCLTLFESACADRRTADRVQNVQIYTTAVTAAASMGDHARALGLVARMVDAGVKPNIKTFTSLMSGYLSSGKTKYALEVLGKIDEPDGYALSLGVKAYCDAGDYVSATKIITEQRDGRRDMSGRQVMASYNYLIQSSLQRFRYGVAREAMSELLNSGYIPSKATFRAIQEGLDFMPKNREVRTTPKKAAMAEAKAKHDYLLFVLDSLASRKLACSGSFYALILFEGSRIGGLRKKVSSLLSQARAKTRGETNREGEGVMSAGGDVDDHNVRCVGDGGATCLGWEDLVQNYASYKGKIGNEIPLPSLRVRIGGKEMRSVLAAERSVTYNSARRGGARFKALVSGRMGKKR